MNNISESRKNFTENTNRNKLKELKEYVISHKEAKDQFYSSKVHTDWEEMIFFISEDKPAKWCVFQVHMIKDDYSIYTFSDENGNVALPKEDAEGFDIDIIYINDDSTIKLLKELQQQSQKTTWRNEIGAVLLALLIIYMWFFLPAQIRRHKLQKEQQQINAVIAKPYADFEKYRNQIIDKVRALEKENPFIYVYTNDTEALDFSILPNLHIYQSNDNYAPAFTVKQAQADDLKTFIDNEDTKGYHILLNTKRGQIVIGKLNKNKTAELNVSMTYFYSKKTKELLKEKGKKIENIDSVQIANVSIPSETEEKPENNARNMLMKFDKPIIQSLIKQKDTTQKIYLSFYSKNASKEELESKIEKFEKLFYDGKKSKDCKIRKVYLESEISSK